VGRARHTLKSMRFKSFLENAEEDLEVGQRVIVRSNEDDPLRIGEITRFEDFGGKAKPPLTVVVDEKTGEEIITMGIVKPYSNELMQQLIPMTAKEQWNFLSKYHKRH